MTEAFYRILKTLHLQESNIQTKFIHTGFPENRSKYLRKLNTNEDEEATLGPNINPAHIIKSPHNDNLYYCPPSIHELYAARPEKLEHISLAQFRMWYYPASKNWKKSNEVDDTQCGPIEVICPHLKEQRKKEPVFLPKTIELEKGLGVMRLRTLPFVLRMHKFKENEDPHQFFYSELVLYRHWRNEDELKEDSHEDCLALFNEESPNNPEISYIAEVKENIFPEKNNVELARAIVEDMDDPDQRPSHIGDQLDAQNEQENEEGEAIGTSVHPEQQVRFYDDDLKEASEKPSIFKRADLTDYESMIEDARKLVDEQRLIFDKVIGYAKELRKSMASGCPTPTPPLIFVQGGAGTGKSKLIETIYLWFEKWLVTNDERNLEQPFAIKVAPTGMAARKINGLTMHSALRLPFNNKMTSLGEQNRGHLREILQSLELLIIDEVSMVRSDQLYQIHMRLQEIKQSTELFGGVAVVLFGDLMQLKPIKGAWIFHKPNGEAKNSHECQSLWEEFEPYTLERNHRQKNDRSFANLLNRIRMAGKDEISYDDLKTLQTRLVQNSIEEAPPEALRIFPKKTEVHSYNSLKMEQLDTPIKSFKATHFCSTTKSYSPTIADDGTVGQTNFLDILEVKVGAKVMLIFNVNTVDGLTNGQTGFVIAIEERDDNKDFIIVQFDDAEAGVEERRKHPWITRKYGNHVTPISRVSFEYAVGSVAKDHTKKVKIIQFPLILAFAITAHKIQGQTVTAPKPVVLNLNSVFQSNMAYVMLGRTENLDQLYLENFESKKIYCDEQSKKETVRIMKESKKNFTSNDWFTSKKMLKVAAVNIRSLIKHFNDLKNDFTLLQSDIIIITETNYHLDPKFRPRELDGYEGFHVKRGKGKKLTGFYLYKDSSQSYDQNLQHSSDK